MAYLNSSIQSGSNRLKVARQSIDILDQVQEHEQLLEQRSVFSILLFDRG